MVISPVFPSYVYMICVFCYIQFDSLARRWICMMQHLFNVSVCVYYMFWVAATARRALPFFIASFAYNSSAIKNNLAHIWMCICMCIVYAQRKDAMVAAATILLCFFAHAGWMWTNFIPFRFVEILIGELCTLTFIAFFSFNVCILVYIYIYIKQYMR